MTRRVRRPHSFAHRFVQFVILNVTLWTWVAFASGRGTWLQLAVWTCGALAMVGWEHAANRREEREYRTAHGYCVKCGYDLQESEARCPECGAAVPAGHRTRSAMASDLEQVQ